MHRYSNMDKKPIVVVGSINIDFVVTAERVPSPGETLTGENFQVHFGGKGANQAVAVGRLGYPVEMIGMVGSDLFGAQLRDGLRAGGVGVDAVETTEGSSGVATISVARSGENAIIVVPGANASVTPDYLDRHKDVIRSAGLVLTQFEIPMETVSHLAGMCESWEVPLVLDPAPARDVPVDLLKRVQWFTPNQTEAAFYAQQIDPRLDRAQPAQIASALRGTGVRAVALKLGPAGVLLHDGELPEIVRGFPVDAVDTTAAGDAFNGAFATGLMLGLSKIGAARFACGAAAISVTRQGAQPSLPVLQEVEELIQGKR
jgi:ribokinase